MMFKKSYTLLALLIFTLISSSAHADQFYGGFGLSITPGQPTYKVDRIPIFVGYESKDLWRFSYSDNVFESDNGSEELKSQILGGERMWVMKLRPGLALIGAAGAGYFSATTDAGSGSALGLVATGTVRFAFSEKVFMQGSMNYRNAAVNIVNTSVDAGYQGLSLAAGYFF